MTRCPDCGARPLPPSPADGRPPARCLACSKAKGGSSWRRFLTRLEERAGAKEAKRIAKQQGVPWSPASSGTSASVAARKKSKARPAPPPPPAAAPTWSIHDAQRLAVGLHASEGDAARAALTVGLPPPSAELVEAARAFKDLADGNPAGLGRLSYTTLAIVLIGLQEKARELAPGAASQMVKPLRDLWQDVGGGVTATEISVIFEEGLP